MEQIWYILNTNICYIIEHKSGGGVLVDFFSSKDLVIELINEGLFIVFEKLCCSRKYFNRKKFEHQSWIHSLNWFWSIFHFISKNWFDSFGRDIGIKGVEHQIVNQFVFFVFSIELAIEQTIDQNEILQFLNLIVRLCNVREWRSSG